MAAVVAAETAAKRPGLRGSGEVRVQVITGGSSTGSTQQQSRHGTWAQGVWHGRGLRGSGTEGAAQRRLRLRGGSSGSSARSGHSGKSCGAGRACHRCKERRVLVVRLADSRPSYCAHGAAQGRALVARSRQRGGLVEVSSPAEADRKTLGTWGVWQSGWRSVAAKECFSCGAHWRAWAEAAVGSSWGESHWETSHTEGV